MNQKMIYYFVIVVSFSSIVTVCAKQNSPLEVSKLFWHAVKNNKNDQLHKYITNKNTDFVQIDGNWSAATITFKEIRILETNAQVETIVEYSEPSKAGFTFFSIVTQIDGEWKVDFDNTMKNVSKQKSALSAQSIMNSIRNFGGGLADQLQDSIGVLKQKRPSLEKELETIGEDVKKEIDTLIKNYGPELKKNLHKFSDELEEILNKALKKKEKQDKNKAEEAYFI